MYCNLRTWSSHRAQAVLNAENAQEAVEMLKVPSGEREFFIDNLLVRIHFIIEMVWWTGLAPLECERGRRAGSRRHAQGTFCLSSLLLSSLKLSDTRSL